MYLCIKLSVFINTEEVWKAVLYLYMKDSSLPLPTFEEY